MPDSTEDKLLEMAPRPTPIPEIFGCHSGDFIAPGLRRYVEIDCIPTAPYWFATATETNDYMSVDYMPGFEAWRAVPPDVIGTKTIVRGILAGFPAIRGRSGETAPEGEQGFVHTWANDEDIDVFSVVVPAQDIIEVRVYSRQRTELELFADYAYDGQQRFKIPLLYDTQTQDWIMRWATEDEIRATGRQHFNRPTVRAVLLGGEIYLKTKDEEPTTVFTV